MGPLEGIRVIELAGIGPLPFCGSLLADMGADVLLVDRPSASDLGVAIPPRLDVGNRNKRSIAIDLKRRQGIETLLQLAGTADILIEGFRPGVTERMGIGPEDCWRVNARLVYGRMTGWGQDGPLSQAAGHDLNYISLVGAVHQIGNKDQPPAVPLNFVGNFGGGALYLAVGVLAALVEARTSGRGQVVDAAIVDGVTSNLTPLYSLKQANLWTSERHANLLDGGAPFYSCYETKDGKYISIAAIEKRFYSQLLDRIGVRGEELPDQDDRERWEELRARFTAVFKSRTRDEWCSILEGSDVCFAPVLDLDECTRHPHVAAREMFVEVDGVLNPAPAPRFGRTVLELRQLPPRRGEHSIEALRDWGFCEADIRALTADAVVVESSADGH